LTSRRFRELSWKGSTADDFGGTAAVVEAASVMSARLPASILGFAWSRAITRSE
jgi:hypothetical protein